MVPVQLLLLECLPQCLTSQEKRPIRTDACFRQRNAEMGAQSGGFNAWALKEEELSAGVRPGGKEEVLSYDEQCSRPQAASVLVDDHEGAGSEKKEAHLRHAMHLVKMEGAERLQSNAGEAAGVKSAG